MTTQSVEKKNVFVTRVFDAPVAQGGRPGPTLSM